MNGSNERDVTFFARTRAEDRIGFWWLADDSAIWQAAKDDLRRSFPHHTGLRYDAAEREWTIPRYSLDRLQRWANAWASRQEWNAARRNGEQRRYAGAQNAPEAPGAALTSAYTTLHLLPSAPPELVTAAYRALAQLHHPDRGGDTGAMTQINQAVAMLRGSGTRRSA